MTKTALITGASRGIGKSLSHYFAKQGYNLVLIAKQEATLTESIKPCEARSGIEKIRFTIKAVVMAKSLKTRGLPRLFCLPCFHSLIASSSIQNVREPRFMRA
ncbi:hypothetical protein BA953_22765 [Vibrio coralliilyticus]|nr:hypothetical protein BA953_22765 [Vibrio coralliilyticus]